MKKIYDLPFTICHRGFTLIELLVAISIIGILSSFLLANFVGVRQRARDGIRKSDLRQIQSALELYRSDKAAYPASPLPSCGSPLQDTSKPPVVYMQKIPCDPSNSSVYTYTASGNDSYTIVGCLENGNDPQKDSSANSACVGTGKTGISYTLQNP